MIRIRGLTPGNVLELCRLKNVRRQGAQHVLLCVADHWEPKYQRPPRHVEQDRVRRWVTEYPRLTEGLVDSRGRPPQHTFFYPEEEYDPHYVEAIAGLC